MKPISKTFNSTGNHIIQLDSYSAKTVINLTSGSATIETSISLFNFETNPVAFEAITLPGKIDYPISGLLVNVTATPVTVEVLQADNC